MVELGPSEDAFPSVEEVLRGRRIRERLLHLRAYLDEPPERSLLIGLELSEAAHEARRGEA